MLISGTPKIDRLVSRQDVQGLLKALNNHKDTTMRQAAASALGQLRVTEAVIPLMHILKSDTPPMRQVAALALGQIGDNIALTPLMIALEDEEQEIRKAAARALGQLGDEQAVLPLIDFLKQCSDDEQEVGFAALVRIGARIPAAARKATLVEPLLMTFTSALNRGREAILEHMGWEADAMSSTTTTPSKRDSILHTIDEIGWQPDQSAAGALYWMFKGEWERCIAIGTPAIPVLINVICDRSMDPYTHQHATSALSKIGSGAVEPLIPLLQHKEPEVRQATFGILVSIGRPAVEPLICNLQDDAPEVRRVTIDLLGNIGDTRSIQQLALALKDTNWSVRQAATTALSNIGKPAIDALIAMLQDTDDNVNWLAAEALEKMGWIPDQSETGAAYWIARNEWERCVEMGAAAVNPLIDSLAHWSEDIRKLAAETLGKLGNMAIDPLLMALKDREPNVREAVVMALADINDPRAVKSLTAALRDKHSSVRKAAINVLVHKDIQEDTLIMALRNDEASVRKVAARALGRTGGTHAIQPLINLLDDGERDVYQAALASLGQIGDARAVEPLIAAIQQREGDDLDALFATLGHIGTRIDPDTLQDELVHPLLNTLHNAPGIVRELVSEMLDELDWQPDDGPDGAIYWTLKDQWERCVEVGEPAVVPLVVALRSNDTHIRQNAAWALSKIGRPAVEHLIPLLQDDDAEVSLVAYSTLVKIGRPAIEPLITILQREGAGVHKAAAEVLGLIGESRVVDPLIAALKDGDAVGREAAVEALVKIGKPARDALIMVLREECDDVRAYAVKALEQIGWQPDRSETGAIYWITKRRWDRCAQMGELAIHPLIDILKDDDQEVRNVAVTALVRIGQPVLEPLIAALQHPHPYVRGSAAWALARLRDERAVDHIVTTLQDDHAQVREAAMKALGLIGDQRVVQPVIAAIKRGNEEDRERGFAALAQIGVRMPGTLFHTALVEPVITAFQEEHVSLREQASAMLENMGWQPDQSPVGAIYWIMRGQMRRCVEIGTAAIEPLTYALRAKDTKTRQNAFWALVSIGEPVIPPLITMLQDSEAEVRQAAFWALVKIGRPTLDALIVALQHESAMVRRSAVEILGRIGDDRAVQSLITMLEDSDVDVRDAAVVALSKIGKPTTAALTHLLRSSRNDMQRHAADALDKIGWQPGNDDISAIYWITRHNWHRCAQIGAPAVRPLIDALTYCDTTLHKSIIQALSHIGHDAAEPLIATLASHKDPNVRGVAAVTLGRIGTTSAIHPLIAALQDPDQRVQKAATWALQPVGIAALHESEGETRRAAAGILGQIGDIQAVQPLIEALKHWDECDHEAAFAALAQIGEHMHAATIQTGLITPLVEAFKGEQRSKYKSVTGLLQQMGLQPDRSSIGAAYHIMQGDWERCVEMGDAAIPALVDALHNTDPTICQQAASTLHQIGWQPGSDEAGAIYATLQHEWQHCVIIGAPAVKPLIAMLSHADETVRTAVVNTLVQIGLPATDMLIATLHDADATRRENAAIALGDMGNVEAIQPLIRAMNACQVEQCEAIFVALTRIGQRLQGTIQQVWLIEPLIAAFKDHERSQWPRVNALIEAVGWQPGESELAATYWMLQGDWERCAELGEFAINPLIEMLQSQREERRLHAAQVLEQIGWQPSKSAQGAIYWIGRGKWSRCVEIGIPAIHPLLAALKYREQEARESIVDALVRIGPPAVKPLINALKDPEPYIREVAAGTLGLLGDTYAVESLIMMLRDEHDSVRAAAVEALAVLGDIRAMKPLIALLHDKHENVRIAAAEAVGIKMWTRRGQTTQLVIRRS